MYKNNFVVCIKDCNGQVLRETNNNEVYLPFYSEYSIKIKNKNDYDCIASIFIDGIDILNGSFLFIKKEDETEIERFFLDENENNGKKFKFVPSDNIKESDKNENGIIRIKLLKQNNNNTYTYYYPYYDPYMIYKPYSPTYPVYSCSKTTSEYETLSLYSGKTEEGLESNQSFFKKDNIIYSDFTEIIIKLKHNDKTLTINNTKNKFCKNCGKKMKIKDFFCSKCGNKL